jgi:hypothetical protein
MGQPDFYPFVLPLNVVAKLHFIHLLVTSASWLPEDAGVVRAAQQEIDQQLDLQTQTQSQSQDGQSQFQQEPLQTAPMQENAVQNA